MLPSPRRLSNLDRPAVRLGDRERGRQAEAEALARLRCGRCRPTKNRSKSRAWSSSEMPGPVVGDRPADEAVASAASQPQRDVAPVGREPLGVRDEVEQRLLEARPVAVDPWAAAVRQRRGSTVWPRWSASGPDRRRPPIRRARGRRTGAAGARSMPDRKRARSRMSPMRSLHPLGVPLDGLEHRPALLVGRV